MIKSISIVTPAPGTKEFEQLEKLFDSLGFERGSGWKEKTNAGASFLAPLGTLEIFRGTGVTTSGILVEVRDLESTHQVLQKSKVGQVGPIELTTWKSRLFRYSYKDFRLIFWQFDSPHKYAFQSIEGELFVNDARFGIVVSRFNSFITERLLQGALDALHRTGTMDKNIEVVRVSGAFEIPLAARTLATSKQVKVNAIICLGLLMRGETSNYEHISSEVARGIGQVAQDSGKPCTYGVLTCDTLEQAIDRAGLKSGNKGFEAAITAVEMVSLQQKLTGRKNRRK